MSAGLRYPQQQLDPGLPLQGSNVHGEFMAELDFGWQMKLPGVCCWRRADEAAPLPTRDVGKVLSALDIDSARVSSEWGSPNRKPER